MGPDAPLHIDHILKPGKPPRKQVPDLCWFQCLNVEQHEQVSLIFVANLFQDDLPQVQRPNVSGDLLYDLTVLNGTPSSSNASSDSSALRPSLRRFASRAVLCVVSFR
jgi:hypothetical protein